MSECSDLNDSPLKTRKRKAHPEAYKRNVIKKLKLRGQEYTGHGGKQHRSRSTCSPCSSSDSSPVECNWKNGRERRTSILKPPKLRTPLKELQFTSNQEVKDDTTARQSRRVSFGHFHIRKFGYENDVVCDSIYSIDSSKSEASSQTHNSVGECNEVPATNSNHHCKNMSPGTTDCRTDSHMKNTLQNASKHKYAETDNTSYVTDIGVCSSKKMLSKQIPDESTVFSAVDAVARRNSSDVLSYKSYGVRTDCKDKNYFQKESFMGRNSIVSGEVQLVHERDDIKQVHDLAKRGREQSEQKNEAEPHDCEHHQNYATVTDMVLADSYSFEHIECKEESLFGRKRKKSLGTTEKSFHFAAESDMELTKVVDNFCYEEILNEGKDKSVSLNETGAKNNFIFSGYGHISKNAKDCNSMKNISQQFNATKRFSTNNAMDITEGCGLINSSSLSDISKSDVDNEINSQILSISRLTVGEDDGERLEEKKSKCSRKYLNPIEFSEKSFINESMEQTVGVGCVLSGSDVDDKNATKDFQKNESVSCHLEFSNDNLLPISDEKGFSVTAATPLPNEDKLTGHVEKCRETKPDDINNFNTSKTILMSVGMETTQNICCSDEDNSFMQFTKVVEGKFEDSSVQEPLGFHGNKHSPTKHFNIEKQGESAIAKSTLKHDIDFTQVKSPLCDSGSVLQVVEIDRQTDVDITAISSKVVLCKDKQNDCVSSHALDTTSNHPLILKPCGNEADESVFILPENANHESYCKERFYEGIINNSIKQTERDQDRSIKCTSPCQTVDKNSKLCTVSSTLPELKSEIIQQGKQANDWGSSICSVPSNSTPISETENISNNRDCAGKILSKYSECHLYSSNRSEPHNLQTQAVEDYLVTDKETRCALGSGISSKKRRSSEKEEMRDGPKSRKKQCVATDDNNDKQQLQSTTAHMDLAEGTKLFYDRDATAALRVNYDVVNTVMSDRPALTIVDVPSDTNSLQANNNMTLWETDRPITNVSLPQPSDPNSKLNSSDAAKTIVFNRPTDFGLDFTCETSFAAIETADCKNKLRGSMPVTYKRNKDSPLPENEILKRNINDIANRSKSDGQKRYTINSEEESNTTGTAANISEVNVPHPVLSEDQNPQPSDPNSKLNSSDAAKTIVFNRPTDFGLDFTCETSFAAIEKADCKNKLRGSTSVTYKRNKDSPLPENEVLININDVANRSKTDGQKRHTVNSEEESGTTGTAANIYEVNVPHALLSEDQNPQPSDPNSKLNSSHAAKTIVFSRPTEFGLDFTCETSSAAIEIADCKNMLRGSTSVTDKRNTDPPLPENEELKRNIDDINRSKTYGEKRYTINSEEASSATGMPANVSELNVPHMLLREDKNPQPSDPNRKLKSSDAAKTIVFNRPTEFGLDFTCETSSAAIEIADCKNTLRGSTSVTDKRNTDSPLPENEELKRNIDDVNRSKTYGEKRYTINSDEASSATGMPANISELKVPHMLLSEDKNPQPSDPNRKLNSSDAAKTIVFNRPTDFGLDFTCETSSAAIEIADCQNTLCGSTSVTDKRNTDSPLPENEALKRNIDDVINRSETYGEKKYTINSEEASSATGMPANISELNVPHMLLREDKNPQPSDPNRKLNSSDAAKTIVFNRPTDFGLDFTCETSFAVIETADCKNKLRGSTSVTYKRNKDSPLPENEVFININDVANRSKTDGQKRHTVNSVEESGTTGAAANISEVNVPHAVLSEDQNPQPSDPNRKLNSSDAAKTIVFNRPTDFGLDFTCETSSAAIEIADCQNMLRGSTSVTDKRNTDPPLPENEALKRNIDDINRSKTYGEKRYTINSEEASSATGMPANVSELNVPHMLLREDKNPQSSDPNRKLNSSDAAKTIVFNRPTEFGLDFTCETSSAAIEIADCKNTLRGSTSVTDKRNTDSPLPENEELKRNIDDVNRSKTYGEKRYTINSDEASSATGMPANISELKVPHMLLSEDKNTQPADPNRKLNSSDAAKTIVFNRPTDFGLDFTCETSSAAIEIADCQNMLCGSTSVTDKRNTDPPLPENEALKRNIDDINRSKTYGEKRYTINSEEASSATGMPANVSELNVPHMLLSEDKNPQPSDPNRKLNSSDAAKTIVFNRPTEFGLDFTCETSSAAIEIADCNNTLRGSTSVTDKRNTDSPLPQNEVLKRNMHYITHRSNSYGQKRYTRNSEENSSTTGAPANTSEINVPYTVLGKDENSQHIEDSGALQKNFAALIDDDKNNLFSPTESNLASVSFMQEDIKVRDYCTETDKNKHKSLVNAELNRDVEKTAVHSQSRYDESLTSVKEGGEQREEEMEISNSSRNNYCVLVAVDMAEKTFHSWHCEKNASVDSNDSAASAGKINLSNSCQIPLGTYKSFPTQALDVANNGVKLDHLPTMNEETGQNVTEIQVARAKETMSAVQIDNTSNYLVKNREQDTFSESRVIPSCDRECLKYSVQENGNSSFGKEMESQQSNRNDPVKRPDVRVEMPNVSSETNNLQKPKEKYHIVSNLMEASEPLERNEPLEISEPLDVNQLLQVHEPLEVSEPPSVKIPCEAEPSYSNTKSRVTRKIVKDSHSVADTAQGCFPVVLGTKLHTVSVDRDKDLPAVGLSVREHVTAVSPSLKSIRQSTARDCTSTAESAKKGMTINGVGSMGGSSVFCGGRQNSTRDSSRSEVAVHSEASHTTEKKMNKREGKKEITVVTLQEEKAVENKCKKLENVIISKAERSDVLWNIRAMTQFQWIFTFLNDTLRLYIDFDKPVKEGTIQDLNFISYLTGKADDDAKFVHFVLLKKFSKDKLKALCKDIEEVPSLLEKISVDVRQMLTFLREFQKLQILYNMEMYGNSVSFNIMSYKLAISFKINIDVSNWEQILEDSITITQNLGKVNEAEVKNLANGVQKNPYFLRNYAKAVKQYMKILERFGC